MSEEDFKNHATIAKIKIELECLNIRIAADEINLI